MILWRKYRNIVGWLILMSIKALVKKPQLNFKCFTSSLKENWSPLSETWFGYLGSRYTLFRPVCTISLATVLMLEVDSWLQGQHCPWRPLYLACEHTLWAVHSTRSFNKAIARLVRECLMVGPVGCLVFHFCRRHSQGPRLQNSCERWNCGMSPDELFSCFVCHFGLCISDTGWLPTNLKSEFEGIVFLLWSVVSIRVWISVTGKCSGCGALDRRTGGTFCCFTVLPSGWMCRRGPV